MLVSMLDSEQREKVNVRLHLLRFSERRVLVFRFRPFLAPEVDENKTVESRPKLKANQGGFNLTTLPSHVIIIDRIKLWKGK